MDVVAETTPRFAWSGPLVPVLRVSCPVREIPVDEAYGRTLAVVVVAKM